MGSHNQTQFVRRDSAFDKSAPELDYHFLDLRLPLARSGE